MNDWIKITGTIFTGSLYVAWILTVANLTALLFALVIPSIVIFVSQLATGASAQKAYEFILINALVATTLIGVFETIHYFW